MSIRDTYLISDFFILLLFSRVLSFEFSKTPHFFCERYHLSLAVFAVDSRTFLMSSFDIEISDILWWVELGLECNLLCVELTFAICCRVDLHIFVFLRFAGLLNDKIRQFYGVNWSIDGSRGDSLMIVNFQQITVNSLFIWETIAATCN